MGCLFALLGGLFPRLALLILWIARPALVAAAFNTFLLPLLGIIFLPFATLIYVFVYTPGIPNATRSPGFGERRESRQGFTCASRREE